MKVRNSLKSLRGRHRANRLVRRKGRVYVINKVQRRFRADPGFQRLTTARAAGLKGPHRDNIHTGLSVSALSSAR